MPDYRIVTVYFPPGISGRYDMARLMRVYWRSAIACGANLEVISTDQPTKRSHLRWADDNTLKLEEWRRVVEQSDVPVVLTDADMLMLDGDFAEAFSQPYDVAVTWRSRTRHKIPMNGGVTFVRPTVGGVEYMRRWCDVNERMMRDAKFHSEWTAKYAGINQAATGYLMETQQTGCDLIRLSCRDWNAVDEDWEHALSHGTRLVHVKGRLRQACMGKPNNRHRLFMRECAGLFQRFDQFDQQEVPCVS